MKINSLFLCLFLFPTPTPFSLTRLPVHFYFFLCLILLFLASGILFFRCLLFCLLLLFPIFIYFCAARASIYVEVFRSSEAEAAS